MVHIPYIQPKRKRRPKEYKSPVVWWKSVRYLNGEMECRSKSQENASPVTTNQNVHQTTPKNPTQS